MTSFSLIRRIDSDANWLSMQLATAGGRAGSEVVDVVDVPDVLGLRRT